MAIKERLESFYNISPSNAVNGEVLYTLHFDSGALHNNDYYSTRFTPFGSSYSVNRNLTTKSLYDSLKTPTDFSHCYCVSTYYTVDDAYAVIDFYAFSSLLNDRNYDYYFSVAAEIDDGNWEGECWSMETSNCTFVESETSPYYEVGVYHAYGGYVTPRPYLNYNNDGHLNPPSGPYPYFLASWDRGYESEAYSKIEPHYNPYGYDPNTSNSMVYRYTMWFKFYGLQDVNNLISDEWFVDCSLYRYPSLVPYDATPDSSTVDVFGLIKSGFDSATSFFSYEVFSGVTIGGLLSVPVILSLLLAVFKLIRK